MKKLVLALDISAVLLVIFGGNISEFMLSNWKDCRLYKDLGMKCLLCGGTRCVNYASKGEISKAFEYNAFVFVAAIILLGVLILMNAGWLFGSQKARWILNKLCSVKVAAISSICAAIFVIARNFTPFVN